MAMAGAGCTPIVLPVTTLEGEVIIKVPAGTQPGKILKLTGKGMPLPHTNRHGDHLVEVTVEVPHKLSHKQKEDLQAYKSAKKKGFFK